MTDLPVDTTPVLLVLNIHDLCRAARLGGLPFALDAQPLDDAILNDELVRFFAKRGIISAIHDCFDRHYPPHYPDDIDASFWQQNSAIFTQNWKGKVSW